jgi:hypothetical protein
MRKMSRSFLFWLQGSLAQWYDMLYLQKVES